MKKCALVLLLVAFSVLFASEGYCKYPKLANYYQNTSLAAPVIPKLAKYDFVIMDYDNLVSSKKGILEMRRLNPDIKIVAYCNPMELFDPMMGGRPLQKKLLLEMQKFAGSNWWMYTTDKKPVFWWMDPPMRMLNLSAACPIVKGEQWSTYLAKFYLANVLNAKDSQGKYVFDGLFIDNLWAEVSFINDQRHIKLDANRDGVEDNCWDIDQSWQKGITLFLKTLKAGRPNAILTGNNMYMMYEDYVEGKMSENFPNDFRHGWFGTMQYYWSETKLGLNYNMLHSEKQYPSAIRYVLCSALMGDGYMCVPTNCLTWLQPEFDMDLGEPLGPAKSPNKLMDSKYGNVPLPFASTKELGPGNYIVTFRYWVKDPRNNALNVHLANGSETRTETSQRWPNGYNVIDFKVDGSGSVSLECVGDESNVTVKDLEIWQVLPGAWTRNFKNKKTGQEFVVVCNSSDDAAQVKVGNSVQTVARRSGVIFASRVATKTAACAK